jgi:hypothetical protein
MSNIGKSGIPDFKSGSIKWFKTLKNASQKKVSMADILGSMEEDNFDGVNSHPSDLGLSKKPEIRGDEDNDPCFLSLPNRRKSKKASTQPSTYVLTVKNKFPKAFVKPSFPSPYIRRPKSYTVMDGVVTSPEIDEEGFPACTQISDECDTAIAAWESAASRLKAVEDPPKKAPEVTEVVFTNLAVASTVVNTYQHLGMTKEMLPKKGMAVWLVPPIASGYIPVKVSWTDTKSTHGERLYRCEHCKPMSEKHLEQGKAATSRMESKMTTTTITVGEVTAEVRPSGWNISLDIYKSGKRVFRVLMANGQTSREPSSSEIAKIKAAGFDPATKRVLMSNPPCTLGTELALAIDAVSLQIKADADAATAEEKAAIDGIEGLKELRAALNERERYSEQFAKMMDDEHNDGVRPPRPAAGNTDDLRARYPRAAAYILAEAWGGAAHDVKASAGNKAVKRILAGDDYAEAIAEMKATWAAHCDQHVWD